eukprot:TRINITY_DN12237_c0_g1_i1.p1 TRINITY_DN12237_c0_g1~~TRINITY_DN12237_c0_g1_i1.p1  ORF type:complete len:999 (-),score=200.18 TRINITY_DN12237_c0_g1_i1:170-3166(-)
MNSLEFQPFQFDPNEFSTPNSTGVNGHKSARYEPNSPHVQIDYDHIPHSAPSTSRDLHYSSVGIESLSPQTDSIIEKSDRLFMKPSSPIGENTLLKLNRPNLANKQGTPSQANQFQHQSQSHHHFSHSPSNSPSHYAISPPSHSSPTYLNLGSLGQTSSIDPLSHSSPPPHMMGLFGPWSGGMFPSLFSNPKDDSYEEPFTPSSVRDPNNSGGQSQFSSNLDSDLDEFMKTCGVDLEISKSPNGTDSLSSGQPPGSSDVLFSLHGEHPLGEHPSRTLFVRNINSNVEDDELRNLFESFGAIRSMYTQCKHRGFVMISYFDIRHAKVAMRHLQGKIIRRRKIDIHYSIPKFNPSEKDQNQGTLVVFNLDSNISNEELKSIFGNYGEIKEVRETPNKKHHKFIEFYDVRDADKAMKQLNKTEIKSKKIKIEPSRPGGARKVLMRQLAYELMDPEPSSPSTSLPSDSRSIFEGSASHFGKTKEHDREHEDILTSASCPATPLSTSPSSDRFFDKFFSGLPGLPPSLPSTPALSPGPFHLNPIGTGPGPHRHQSPPHHRVASPSGSPGYGRTSLSAADHTSFSSSDRMSVSPSSRTLSLANSPTSPDIFYLGGLGAGVGIGGSPRSSPSSSRGHSPTTIRPGPVSASVPGPSPSANGLGAGGYPPLFHGHLHGHGHVGAVYSSGGSPTGGPAPTHASAPALAAGPGASFGTGISSASAPASAPSHSLDKSQTSPSKDLSSPSSLKGEPVGPVSSTPRSSRNLRPDNGNHIPIITTSPPPSANSPINNNNSGHNSNASTHHHNNSTNNKVEPSPSSGSSGSSNGAAAHLPSSSEEKLLFSIDLTRVAEGQDVRTTLMIKNIPNKYSQKMLLSAVDEKHKGLYDFFYLPIDFKNKCNVGYAFINFISPLSISSFYSIFNHSKWEKFNSEKVCAITYARIQGKNSLISHFQNSSLMCEDRKCRPIIFHSEGPNQGELEPFPVGPNARPRRGGASKEEPSPSRPFS